MPVVDWLKREDIRPYLYIRKENRPAYPGVGHPIHWFEDQNALVVNPMKMKNIDFAEAIYNLEGSLFSSSGMQMPRWVFYDCAVMPGIVVGFCMHKDSLTDNMKKVLRPAEGLEWVPISLFIAIPTNSSGQWVAHNLCSINYVIPQEEQLKGLGFLSKAFALWYANIQNLCGMTQWDSPALKLHSQYGHLEIVSAYTPVHSYSKTLTYRTWVDSKLWPRYFYKEPAVEFHQFYEESGVMIDPKLEESMQILQRKIEVNAGPFYLSGEEIRNTKIGDRLNIYKLKKRSR